ncbi:MAG TPA: hypothetical protein VJ714_08415 [Anaerolineae bacterium]|nr:hypothetical protein [Anaerolineae bacterium]
MGGRSSSSICQISVGVGETGSGVAVARRRGFWVSVGWGVAVLVGVESMAATVAAAGVTLAGVSSGSTEGTLQARTVASSRDNSKQITGLDITACSTPFKKIHEGLFVILSPAPDTGEMAQPTT